jgi:hypothetical protein
MVLHLVSTEAERAMFVRAAQRAGRQNRGAEITLSPGASMADLHLYYGRAYMLLDDGVSQERTPIAGFAFHSLDQFAQSHPDPALGHLGPGGVFEIGHLWCATRHKLQPLLKGLLILSGLLQIDALLIYPAMTPRDYTGEFQSFRRVTKPISVPSRDDAAVWVQGMLLQADDLRIAAGQAMDHGFEIHAGFESIEFMSTGDGLEDHSQVSAEVPAGEPPGLVN